jgi:hypothetical protein
VVSGGLRQSLRQLGVAGCHGPGTRTDARREVDLALAALPERAGVALLFVLDIAGARRRVPVRGARRDVKLAAAAPRRLLRGLQQPPLHLAMNEWRTFDSHNITLGTAVSGNDTSRRRKQRTSHMGDRPR